MKALSLRQPWAWAILHAGKRVENRVWRTSYRGPILIHASKTCPIGEYRDAVEWMVHAGFARSPLAELGSVAEIVARVLGIEPENLPEVPSFDALPRGGIVGRARIVDVLHPTENRRGRLLVATEALSETGAKPRAPWHIPSQFGFVLADVEALPFRKVSGLQRFFEVPDEPASVTLSKEEA